MVVVVVVVVERREGGTRHTTYQPPPPPSPLTSTYNKPSGAPVVSDSLTLVSELRRSRVSDSSRAGLSTRIS